MRPDSIIWFERLFLATLLIGLVHSAATWNESVAIASPAFVLAVQAFSIAVVLTLTLLVSRKRSNVAKWINVALFAVGLVGIVHLVATEKLLGSMLVTIAQTLMQGAGIALLFTASARAWLGRKDAPATEAELRQTFD